MAARRAVTVDTSTTNAVDVLVILAEDSASEDAPLSVTNIAVELNEDNATIIPLLDELEDFGLAQYENVGGQFSAWLTVDGVTPSNAPEIFAAAVEKKTGKKPKTVDTPAPAPVESEAQTNTEETDSMDENIIGSWENPVQETHYIPYVEGAVTGHMILPEPLTMAAPPEGVNPNTWELYKAGNTAPARLFWGNKVAEQMKAHALAQAVLTAPEETEPTTPAKSFGVDPVTGEAFPF